MASNTRHDLVVSRVEISQGPGVEELTMSSPEHGDVTVEPGDKVVIWFSASGIRLMGQFTKPAAITPGDVGEPV